MPTRNRIAPDGTVISEEIPEGASFLPPRNGVAPSAPVPTASASPARARLAKARTGKLEEGQERFEPVEVEGETFYIKRLAWADITRVHLEADRGTGVLDLQQNADALRAFTISCLDACIYSAPEEGAKYFTQEEAAEWVDSLEPEIMQLVTGLSNFCLLHNKLLLPQQVRGRGIPSAAPVPVPPPLPEANSASSSLTEMNGSTGSTPAGSSEPPATLPTGSVPTTEETCSSPTEEASPGP